MNAIYCKCGADVSTIPFDESCPSCGMPPSQIMINHIIRELNITPDMSIMSGKICMSCGYNFKGSDLLASKVEHEQKSHPLFYCTMAGIEPYSIDVLFDFYLKAIEHIIPQFS